MSGWYVVNTLPHQEARAETNLLRQGYRAWLPSIKRSRRHARRILTILAPLFPGYLFVELDLEQDSWSPINGTFGVRRLLCHDNRPALVPADLMQSLRQAEEDGVMPPPESGLKPGQRVRLIAGPFVYHIGTLVHIAAGERVALLLRILGQEISTVVPKRMVAPAS